MESVVLEVWNDTDRKIIINSSFDRMARRSVDSKTVSIRNILYIFSNLLESSSKFLVSIEENELWIFCESR